jgi:fibronectin-binding autotransporter adhesin
MNKLLFKKRILASSMLVAPAMLAMGAVQPVLADCSVTAGGGTVANPDDGATVTCAVAGGDHTAQIGDGTAGNSVTIDIEDGATVDKAAGNAIVSDSVILTLGSGSVLEAQQTALYTKQSTGDISSTVTLGANSRITTVSGGRLIHVENTGGGASSIVTLQGDNSMLQNLSTSDYAGGIFTSASTAATSVVTLSGANALISTARRFGHGVYTYSNNGLLDSIVTLSGDSAAINAVNSISYGVKLRNITGGAESVVILSGDDSYIKVDDFSVAINVYSRNDDVHNTVTLSGNNSYISVSGPNLGGGVDTHSRSANVSSLITLSGDGSHIRTSGDSAEAINTLSGSEAYGTSILSGNGAYISTSGDFATGVDVSGSSGTATATITLSGDGTYVSTSGDFASGVSSGGYFSNSLTQVTLSGIGSKILTTGSSADGARAYSYYGDAGVMITLSGDNSQIYTTGDNASAVIVDPYDQATASITLSGDNASLKSTGANGHAIDVRSTEDVNASATITLDSNTSVFSTQADGIKITSGGANDATTIDSAGLIQGGDNSIELSSGDDIITLRTGSNLSSVNGADAGGGVDTLNLEGSGSEDEVFLNVETVNVNGTAWELSSTSSFDDINANAGVFTNSGALTVANNVDVASGATYTGAGTLAGDLDVRAGGFWRGIGTVTGNVTNAGTVAPGNSIGTQNIVGNFVQGAGGTLEVEINTAGGTDLLNITGSATLDGALSIVGLDGDVADGTTYTFIQTTGGVAGAFASVVDNLAGTDFTVQTVGNNVIITAGAGGAVTVIVGQDDNEDAVAAAVNDLIASGGGGDLGAIFSALSSAEQSTLLSSQSGLIAASTIGGASSALGKVINIVRGRLSPIGGQLTGLSGGDEVSEYGRPALWIEGVGGFGSVDGDESARGADYETFGGAAGAEFETVDEDAVFGGFVAFTQTESEVDGLQDDGKVRSYQAGVYGSKEFDRGWRLDGSVSASWLKFETARPTTTGVASAEFDGYGAFGYVEAAYDLAPQRGVRLAPYVGIETSYIHHEEYTESGAGALNLKVEAESTTQLSSELGMAIVRPIKTEKLWINPSMKIGWAHEFLDQSAGVSSSFVDEPTAVFKGEGAKVSRDSAKLGLGLSIEDHDKTMELYGRYRANLAADAQDHLFTAGFKWKL